MMEEPAPATPAWIVDLSGTLFFAHMSAVSGGLFPSSCLDTSPAQSSNDDREESCPTSTAVASSILFPSTCRGFHDDRQPSPMLLSSPQEEPLSADQPHIKADASRQLEGKGKKEAEVEGEKDEVGEEEKVEQEEQEQEEEEEEEEKVEEQKQQSDRSSGDSDVSVLCDGGSDTSDSDEAEGPTTAGQEERLEEQEEQARHGDVAALSSSRSREERLLAAVSEVEAIVAVGLSPSSSPTISASSSSSSSSSFSSPSPTTFAPLALTAPSSAAADVAEPPQELLCPICLELHVRPVELPCTHTSCADCLRRWSKEFAETLERRAKDGVRSYGLSDVDVQQLQSEPSLSSTLLASRCSVCCGDEQENDPIVCCTQCGVHVHETCYGQLDSNELTQQRLCEPCKLNTPLDRRTCVLCSNTDDLAYKQTAGRLPDGTMSVYHPTKLTELTHFVHVSCAFHHPPPTFAEGVNEWNSPVCNIAKVDRRRFVDLRCMFCQSVEATACLQCNYAKCTRAYCVPCGLRHGVKFETRVDPETDEEDSLAPQHFSFCTTHRKYSGSIRCPNQPPETRKKKRRAARTRCPVCREWVCVSLVHRSLLLTRRYDLSMRVHDFRTHNNMLLEGEEDSEEEPSSKKHPAKPPAKQPLGQPLETIAKTRARRSTAGTHQRRSSTPSIAAPPAEPVPSSAPSSSSSPAPSPPPVSSSQPSKRRRTGGKRRSQESEDAADGDGDHVQPLTFSAFILKSARFRSPPYPPHHRGSLEEQVEEQLAKGDAKHRELDRMEEEKLTGRHAADMAVDESTAQEERCGDEFEHGDEEQAVGFVEMNEQELTQSLQRREHALRRPYMQRLLSSLVREREGWTVDNLHAELSRDDLLQVFLVHGCKQRPAQTKEQCVRVLLDWIRQGKVMEAAALQETLAWTSSWQERNTPPKQADAQHSAVDEREQDDEEQHDAAEPAWPQPPSTTAEVEAAFQGGDEERGSGGKTERKMEKEEEEQVPVPPPVRSPQMATRQRRRKRPSSRGRRSAFKLAKRARAQAIEVADEKKQTRKNVPAKKGDSPASERQPARRAVSLSSLTASTVQPPAGLPLLPRLIDLVSDDEELPADSQTTARPQPQLHRSSSGRFQSASQSSPAASHSPSPSKQPVQTRSSPSRRSSSSLRSPPPARHPPLATVAPSSPSALLPSSSSSSPVPSSSSVSSLPCSDVRQSWLALSEFRASLHELTEGHVRAVQRDGGAEGGEGEAARVVSSVPSVVGEVRGAFCELHELLYRVEGAMIAERVNADIAGLARRQQSRDARSSPTHHTHHPHSVKVEAQVS